MTELDGRLNEALKGAWSQEEAHIRGETKLAHMCYEVTQEALSSLPRVEHSTPILLCLESQSISGPHPNSKFTNRLYDELKKLTKGYVFHKDSKVFFNGRVSSVDAFYQAREWLYSNKFQQVLVIGIGNFLKKGYLNSAQ